MCVLEGQNALTIEKSLHTPSQIVYGSQSPVGLKSGLPSLLPHDSQGHRLALYNCRDTIHTECYGASVPGVQMLFAGVYCESTHPTGGYGTRQC